MPRKCRFYGNVDSIEEEGRNKRRSFQFMSVMPMINTPDVVAADVHGVTNYTVISGIWNRHSAGGVLTVIF